MKSPWGRKDIGTRLQQTVSVVLRRWESKTGNFVLTTGLKMYIGHRKELKG